MNLDDLTIYVFVRGDLKEEDQAIQMAHAVFAASIAQFSDYSYRYSKLVGIPRIVALDGGTSEKAFSKTVRKLREKNVPIVEFCDPDRVDLGVSAISTYALNKEDSLPLANYRLRRYSPVAQKESADKSSPEGASEMLGQNQPGEPAKGLA